MLLLLALALLVVWAVGALLLHVGAIIDLVLLGAIVLFVWHWLSTRQGVG